MFEIKLRNTTREPLDYTFSAVLGHGPFRPTQAEPVHEGDMHGVKITSHADDVEAETYSELLVATDAGETSSQTYLYHGLWFDSLQVYWNDLNRPGRFEDRKGHPSYSSGGMRRDRDHSLQAAHITVAPGEAKTVRFLIGWYVPNFSKYWVSPVWHFEDLPANIASGRIGTQPNGRGSSILLTRSFATGTGCGRKPSCSEMPFTGRACHFPFSTRQRPI